MLNERLVDNAAGRRVGKSTVRLLDEETLSDALVHDNDSNSRLFSNLVVEISNDRSELGDLVGKDLLSHRITDTISVDDEVSGLRSFMGVLEAMNSFSDEIFHLVLDDFLSLSLHDIIRIVLTHGAVGGSGETNNGLFATMADIDTDKHGLHGAHASRELHGE